MAEPAVDPAPAAPKKVAKIHGTSPKYEAAIRAVIDKKQYGYNVDYKSIAIRFDCNWETLKNYYKEWTKGRLRIGPPSTVEEERIDAEMQLQELQKLAKRHLKLEIDMYRSLIGRGEDLVGLGKLEEAGNLGMEKPLARIKKILETQSFTEKGYASLLDDIAEQRAAFERRIRSQPNEEKKVEATEIQTQVVRISDEQRALALLRGEPTPSTSPVTESPNGAT